MPEDLLGPLPGVLVLLQVGQQEVEELWVLGVEPLLEVAKVFLCKLIKNRVILDFAPMIFFVSDLLSLK